MGVLKNFLENWRKKHEQARKKNEAIELEILADDHSYSEETSSRRQAAELYAKAGALYAEIHENDNAAHCYFEAGNHENELKNYAAANQWFELAINLDPECDETAYRNLAVNCATGNSIGIDHARAAELFKKAAKLTIDRRMDLCWEKSAAECFLLAAEQEDLLNRHAAAEKLRKKAAELKNLKPGKPRLQLGGSKQK